MTPHHIFLVPNRTVDNQSLDSASALFSSPPESPQHLAQVHLLQAPSPPACNITWTRPDIMGCELAFIRLEQERPPVPPLWTCHSPAICSQLLSLVQSPSFVHISQLPQLLYHPWVGLSLLLCPLNPQKGVLLLITDVL